MIKMIESVKVLKNKKKLGHVTFISHRRGVYIAVNLICPIIWLK